MGNFTKGKLRMFGPVTNSNLILKQPEKYIEDINCYYK